MAYGTSSEKSSDEALAIAEFIRRTLIGSNIFDLQDLCIEEHKSVWTVHLDCMCLSDGGSIIDCALLGSGNCAFAFGFASAGFVAKQPACASEQKRDIDDVNFE